MLLTTSCTHALEMTALLLRVGPGDEIILPSFTFVSTANAFALRGATPVFADIRPDTLNIDPADVARRITPRTAAIVVVHYAGIACDMDAILALAQPHGIPVIEDNAHGLFGAYRGRPLGSFGALSTLSFHETKNFTCGEGGALVINDAALIERAEIVREKGTNRSTVLPRPDRQVHLGGPGVELSAVGHARGDFCSGSCGRVTVFRRAGRFCGRRMHGARRLGRR